MEVNANKHTNFQFIHHVRISFNMNFFSTFEMKTTEQILKLLKNVYTCVVIAGSNNNTDLIKMQFYGNQILEK